MGAVQRHLYATSSFTPRATRQFEVQRETLRFSAWLTGGLPVLYGIATWLFGTSLWASSSVYTHALAVPGAPQSWGTVFIVLGVASIVTFERRQQRAAAVIDMLAAFVLAAFMASFILAGFKLHLPMAVSPAISYGVFALLYMDLARLAWKSRDRQ